MAHSQQQQQQQLIALCLRWPLPVKGIWLDSILYFFQHEVNSQLEFCLLDQSNSFSFALQQVRQAMSPRYRCREPRLVQLVNKGSLIYISILFVCFQAKE